MRRRGVRARAGLVAGAVPAPSRDRGRQRTETKAGRTGPGAVWAGPALTCTARRSGAGRGGHGGLAPRRDSPALR